MNDIVDVGFRADTSQVLKGEQALDDLTDATLRADAATKGLGEQVQVAGNRVSTFANRAVASATVGFEQLRASAARAGAAVTAGFAGFAATAQKNFRLISLQLSQVVQQGAVTGDFLRAFAVQAADIGLVFGTVGIAIGAAITLLGPLASGFFNSRKEADSLEKSLDNLADTVDTLNSPLKILELSLDELIEKYGAAAQQVRLYALAQAELAVAQAQRRLQDEVILVGKVIDQYVSLQDAGRDYRNTLARIQKDFDLSAGAARDFENVLQDLAQATSFDEQEAALGRTLEAIRENGIALSELPPELQRAIDEMITLQRETAAAEVIMDNLASAASNVTIGNFGALDGLTGDQLLPGLAAAGEEELAKAKSRSGGGAGKRDTFESDLERLTKSLETEREVAERFREEALELADDARAKEILGEEQHKETLLRIEQEYQERLRGIIASDSTTRIAQTEDVFGRLANAARRGGDDLVKAAAAFGAVEATINAYRAAAQAAADPSVPFLGKIAAYGTVLTTVLGAVKGISSAAGGGVGGAPATGATGTSAVSETTESTRRVLLDFQGAPSWFSGMFEDISKQLQDESDVGVIFEVAR